MVYKLYGLRLYKEVDFYRVQWFYRNLRMGGHMLISEDIYNNKSSMMYCMASFNSSYLVLFADDYFYNYAGLILLSQR